MADISKITLPNNNEYDLKDATARSGLTSKQDKITANGILQGDGSGNISAVSSSAAGTISIDNAPTLNSSNLVTSGGVYTAINNIPSDDHKWNDVALDKSPATADDGYIPMVGYRNDTTAYLIEASSTPSDYSIAKYDGSAYLKSTTPSSDDNTTKVATTAFVQTALSNVDALPAQSSSTDGKVLTSVYNSSTSTASASWETIRPIEAVTYPTFDDINNTYNHKVIEVTSGSYPKLYISHGSFSVNDEFWIISYIDSTIDVAGSNADIYINGSNLDPGIKITKKYQVAYFKLVSIANDSYNTEYWIATLTSADTIPTPSTTTPSMDGTASYGSGTSYARSNHVHPTDTSRASSTHTHGNITNGGDITATAPTIANGDQLIINDDSASKITNGPTFDGSTTNKYLSPKGTWENTPSIASTSSVLKGDGSGNAVAATAGVDYQSPITTEEVTEITVDTTVTASSNNLITSGAVATALANVDSLPSQTGNNGKFLTTNGTTASWAAVPDASSMLNRSTAVNVADTNYSTVMARGIYAGDSDLSEGVSLLTSGVVYLYYE